MRLRRLATIALLVTACSDDGQASGPLGLGSDSATSGIDPTADPESGGSTSDSAGEADSNADSTGMPPTTLGDDTGAGDETGLPEGPLTCAFESNSFGNVMQELDVEDDPNSPIRLSFTVPGLPDPSLISNATLRFRGYDLDHPGEEGYIYVNGGAGHDLPAAPAGDNAESEQQVDITADVVAGTNTIQFGPGPLDRSFFRIGDVQIEVVADVDDCEEVTGGDDTGTNTGNGVEQAVHYTDAEYTERHNWVWRCNGPTDYAFTAANPKHIPSDCGNAYDPDGSAHGTATFHFENVVEDDYVVQISAYHTANRNPNGARIIVDGVVGNVDQRSDGDSYAGTAEWGVAHLSGNVDIVLDSAQGGYASDAVTEIRIIPVQ